jgi:hypothetical protein
MAYELMSDDDKVLTAIRFVARGAVIPTQLQEFLRKENLYELIANPQELQLDREQLNQRTDTGCIGSVPSTAEACVS